MKQFFENLKSLLVAVFAAMGAVLTGQHGWRPATFAWLQLFIQFGIASLHTYSLQVAFPLAVLFFIGEAVAALWAFQIAKNRANKQHPTDVPNWYVVKAEAILLSALLYFVFTCALGDVLSYVHIVYIHGFLKAALTGAVFAAYWGNFLVELFQPRAQKQS